MKKIFVLFSFFIVNISLGLKFDESVIPNASYLIYDGEKDIRGILYSTYKSKFVYFFTFDGNLLKKIEHRPELCCKASRCKLINKLDKNAAKPQPVRYEIRYWPAFKIGYWTKGAPGDFILFYDKNTNVIESYRFDKSKQEITIFFDNYYGENGVLFDFTKKSTATYSLKDLFDSRPNDFPLDLTKCKK